MKFTSEDLMKAMGLQVGDTIILDGKTHTFTTKKDGTLICKNVLKQLIDQDFEILPRPKRVGDLKCEDFNECAKCPFKYYHVAGHYKEQTLYEILKDWLNKTEDQEIYELLKKRLDKEVE